MFSNNGWCSSKSHTGEKHCYYQCHNCKTRVSEKKIEQETMKFLNDMLDYFLLIDHTFKPTLNQNINHDLKKYTRILEELNTKEKRIKTAFVDGYLESKDLKEELDLIMKQKVDINPKLKNYNKLKLSMITKRI